MKKILATLLVLGLFAGTANAAMIAGFDYGTSSSPVAAGATQVTQVTTPTLDTASGISLATSTASGFRNRPTSILIPNPPSPLSTFEEDLIFGLAFTSGSTVTFTLTGLDPNTAYDITGYAHDSESGNNGKSVNWTTNGGTVNHVTSNTDAATAPFSLATLTSDANGTGTITANFDASGSIGGTAIVWNGFVIEAVPEPASLALFGIGGLMMLRRRSA